MTHIILGDFFFQANVYVSDDVVQVGHSFLPRRSRSCNTDSPDKPLSLLHHSLKHLEPLMKCVQMNWMAILVNITITNYRKLFRDFCI